MTTLALCWFDCSRCNKPFLSYVISNWERNVYDENRLISEVHGDITDNSYLKPIKNARLCKKCRKGGDIQSFINMGVV